MKHDQLSENKMLLLYFVKKMGIALSNSEICQFALEKNYMDYFTIQQYIAELTESHLFEKKKFKNHTHYALSKEANEITYDSFLSEPIQQEIHQYVQENKKRIHTELEVATDYFLENNDYVVKCALCDTDGINLMEIKLTVATQEQAKIICNHWKNDVSRIYSVVLNTLVSQPKKERP